MVVVLPGEEDCYVMVMWMRLIAWVNQLLPLTEAPEGVVSIVADFQGLTESELKLRFNLILSRSFFFSLSHKLNKSTDTRKERITIREKEQDTGYR